MRYVVKTFPEAGLCVKEVFRVVDEAVDRFVEMTGHTDREGMTDELVEEGMFCLDADGSGPVLAVEE